MSEDREYDWDEKIDNPDEGDFTILPDGIYPFEVQQWDRGEFEGSDKLPACKSATVHIKFDGGSHGEVTVQHKLFLHSKMTGLLSQFFKGIGLRESGDPLVLCWDKITGCRGYAKLGTRPGKKEDTKFQTIKSFVPRKDWPVEPAENTDFPPADNGGF